MWFLGVYFKMHFKNLASYFAVLAVGFHELNSLWGFFTLIIVFSQLFSGTMLAFSLIPDAMLIPMSRDEEDCEDLVIDDFFWLHERGVDLIFVFIYLHLFRKIYMNLIEYEHEVTWKSGVFTFIIFQVVVFFGLVLCCSHLSEITLTIAANIMHTFFLFFGKVYWWLFTDKQLNCDTLLRLAYGHYLIAFFMAYLGLLHGIDMHYDWKNEASFDGLTTEMAWWDEALSNELNSTIFVLVVISLICIYLYPYPEALSYEIFMWGDIGFINDIRFYGVAPHWYFRPLMAWLLVCPFHKLGIAGLVFFFVVLFYQPNIHNDSENLNYTKKTVFNYSDFESSTFFSSDDVLIEINLLYQITYGFFFFLRIIYLYIFTLWPIL
jgi:quinol-cytochrome oxidoreductase complex cytochrome b subunit